MSWYGLVLYMLDISAVLELEGPKLLLILGASSLLIVLLFIVIWVLASINALKFENYWPNKYLWYIGNKFFTTIVNCSSLLGLFII